MFKEKNVNLNQKSNPGILAYLNTFKIILGQKLYLKSKFGRPKLSDTGFEDTEYEGLVAPGRDGWRDWDI